MYFGEKSFEENWLSLGEFIWSEWIVRYNLWIVFVNESLNFVKQYSFPLYKSPCDSNSLPKFFYQNTQHSSHKNITK